MLLNIWMSFSVSSTGRVCMYVFYWWSV